MKGGTKVEITEKTKEEGEERSGREEKKMKFKILFAPVLVHYTSDLQILQSFHMCRKRWALLTRILFTNIRL